jgi:hypothetical protein
MIELKAIPESNPNYKDGLRFTMRVNGFLTYYLTLKDAKVLMDELTKLMD